MKRSTIIIIAIIVILFFMFRSSYNGLVGKDETVKQAWNNVQSDYQRRSDLIPNLVNTVEGEANFEKSTLQSVIQARASATQVKLDASDLTPEKMQQYQQAQGALSQSLGRLLAVSENYPDLQTNQAFQGLQAQLEGTENRIKVSRDRFNAAIQDYNISVRSFPTNLLAGMTGFHEKTGFTADSSAQTAPTVNFPKN